MSDMESRAPRVGHKKSRKGCAQCKRRHVKVCLTSSQERVAAGWVANRVRSVMKRSPARIAFDTELRVHLLADRMCHEKMPSIEEHRLRRRRQRLYRRRHPKMLQRAAPTSVERAAEGPVQGLARSPS